MTTSHLPRPPASSTREDLVQAALDELAECGHAGVSLRAVARRAGVSHAAPKNHFRDRAGLLTAVAVRGFDDLTSALEAVPDTEPRERLAALGRVYVDFGLARPALFDLMFRPVELDADDVRLHEAQSAAIRALVATSGEVFGPTSSADPGPVPALMSWALVHGLVVLTRDGALRDPGRPGSAPDPALAHEIAAAFSRLPPTARSAG